MDTPTLLDSVSASPREGRDTPVADSGPVSGPAADSKDRTGRAVLEKCVAEMERQARTEMHANDSRANTVVESKCWYDSDYCGGLQA